MKELQNLKIKTAAAVCWRFCSTRLGVACEAYILIVQVLGQLRYGVIIHVGVLTKWQICVDYERRQDVEAQRPRRMEEAVHADSTDGGPRLGTVRSVSSAYLRRRSLLTY